MGTRTSGRPYCENGEYVSFARRIMRALGRRAGADIELLPAIGELVAEMDAIAVEAIVGARAEGWSWHDIAQRLGTTKQAAHQRYAARVAKRQAELDAERAVAAAEVADVWTPPAVEPVDLGATAYVLAGGPPK